MTTKHYSDDDLDQPAWLMGFAQHADSLTDALRDALAIARPGREQTERVMAACDAEYVFHLSSESRNVLQRALREVGADASEPVMGVTGSEESLVIFTDRRVISTRFMKDVGNHLIVNQLFANPAELEICVGDVDRWVSPRFYRGDPSDRHGKLSVEICLLDRRTMTRMTVIEQLIPMTRSMAELEFSRKIPEVHQVTSIAQGVYSLNEVLVAQRELNQPVLRTSQTPRTFAVARLIRSASDAEANAAEFMQSLGMHDARVTLPGADGGIDVTSAAHVAQVKAEVILTSRPVVQQIVGAAAVEGKTPLFFSLAGYTREALNWSERAGLALFQFDLQGSPSACNTLAEELLTRASTASNTLADEESEEGDDSDRIYPQLEDLPWYYAKEARSIDTLPVNWRPLDWPRDEDGDPMSEVAVASIWPIDPAEWDWCDEADDEALEDALRFRFRLRPRPALQFGSGISGVGFAWLAMEVPSPPGTQLWAVQAAPLPLEFGKSVDLTVYGMTPPILAYCGGFDEVLKITQPWRHHPDRDQAFAMVVSAREGEAREYEWGYGEVEPLPVAPTLDRLIAGGQADFEALSRLFNL